MPAIFAARYECKQDFCNLFLIAKVFFSGKIRDNRPIAPLFAILKLEKIENYINAKIKKGAI